MTGARWTVLVCCSVWRTRSSALKSCARTGTLPPIDSSAVADTRNALVSSSLDRLSSTPAAESCKSAPKTDPTDLNSFKDLRCRLAFRPRPE
jgi:hypothetical protein